MSESGFAASVAAYIALFVAIVAVAIGAAALALNPQSVGPQGEPGPQGVQGEAGPSGPIGSSTTQTVAFVGTAPNTNPNQFLLPNGNVAASTTTTPNYFVIEANTKYLFISYSSNELVQLTVLKLYANDVEVYTKNTPPRTDCISLNLPLATGDTLSASVQFEGPGGEFTSLFQMF